MRTSSGSDMTKNGAPPQAAAVLYAGQVMHQRMKPVRPSFRYDVFSLMIDLDRLDEADRLSVVFSVNRRNLLSFHEKDHTGDSVMPLRAMSMRLLATERLVGAASPRASRLLPAHPRSRVQSVGRLLCLWRGWRAGRDDLRGSQHIRRAPHLCLPDRADDVSDAGIRQQCDKLFHVSPFIPMAMRYQFRMLPPGEEIRWRILETDKDGPLLAATFSGVQVPLKTGKILRLVARIPHLTLKIVAGIHWEALKLWIKGVRYIARPQAPEPTSAWKDGRRTSPGFSHESQVGGPAE
jgi:DUF1365 family protein